MQRLYREMSFTQFPLKSAFHTANGPRTKTKKLTLILLLNELQTLFRFCLLKSFLCTSVQSRTPLCISLSHLFSLLCSVTVSFLFSMTLAVLERMVQVSVLYYQLCGHWWSPNFSLPFIIYRNGNWIPCLRKLNTPFWLWGCHGTKHVKPLDVASPVIAMKVNILIPSHFCVESFTRV